MHIPSHQCADACPERQKGGIMDLRAFVDGFASPACIVSVEKTDDGYGEMRIAFGNKKFLDMMNLRYNDSTRPNDTAESREGELYTEFFPKNSSFEDACYRAAVLKEEIHTYAHISEPEMWFDIYVLPVAHEEEDIFYCTYISVASRNADSITDTINSSQTAKDVLKTCIKLHKAESLKEAMDSVIADIRRICDAECCTVLMLEDDEQKISILAADFREGSIIRPVTQFDEFHVIVDSWIGMLNPETDCIIIRDKADMEYIHEVNDTWYQTLVIAGIQSVVLFPLRQGSEVLGFIWAVNFDTEKTMRIKETLELTTFFISSHIARYKVMKRLHLLSYTDVLTGLPNRFACKVVINELINGGGRFAAVSVNLNNFKSINSTLGFEAGNHAIVQVAELWKAVAESPERQSKDHVTHLSGDEFMIVISGFADDDELRAIIERYAAALSGQLTVDGCDLYISACYGYAEYSEHSVTADDLISHANAAMNEIKKTGSSEYILRYTPDITKNEHTLEVENVIRTALENDTVFFNLQPQYDMEHRLRGFEALARMKDSEGNNVSPGEFIPVAEKVGVIDRLDTAVYAKAAMFFGKMLKKTGADLTLSINASVRHLMKNGFASEIRDLLKASGIPADKLEIEITESIMMDSDKALGCINELKAMGVKIAIDDFGTGYSSLSYLNRFPADILKVDKSFIDKMNTTESSRQYVAAIISMGHIMGFDVISEGVEEDDQLETLRGIGCDFIQGYIWGRPLSPEDARKLIEDTQV